MVELGGRSRFRAESPKQVWVARRGENFDRDCAIQPAIYGFEHAPEPPVSDFAIDLVWAEVADHQNRCLELYRRGRAPWWPVPDARPCARRASLAITALPTSN